MAPVVRILGPDDEPAFRAFLEPRSTSSMFLLSNSRAAGLVDEGKRLQATYVGAFAGDRIIGVAAHCWNGMLLVQSPPELVTSDLLAELVTTALARSGRELTGFSGPADHVAAARRAVTLPRAPALDEVEGLYALTLSDLRVPRALAEQEVVCRAPTPSELPQLVDWRRAYHIESLGSADNPELLERARREIENLASLALIWVLESNGELVAMTGFNARIPQMAQVGGVYTPPERRSRGYARCAVAGSLLGVRAGGAERAILFTKNQAAARAYEAIGFTRIGEYALVLL